MQYSIDHTTFPYRKAERLINELKQSDISATITQGGLAIYPTDETQVDTMFSICNGYDITPFKGPTSLELVQRSKGKTNPESN